MVTRKRCKVCNLDNREEIEAQLETMSISPDVLDRQYNWSSGTTARHQRNHMGEYFDASNPQCNICTHEIRGLIEEQLKEGAITPAVVSQIAECSEEQVKRHMRKHLQPLVQKSAATIIAVKEVDEIESLTNTIYRLEQKIDILFDQDEIHPKYVDSLTKLAKEIRESLRYLMEFKGKLVHKRQDTIIVAQMQVVQEVLAQNHPQVWLDVKSKMEERMV
mgnify:FL=1|tara:strand:+ start:3158 stop:3814 length:657 start_codon:yes stop_codon:yes gene_type:complete